jgi:hypothetical protein
MNSNKGNAVSSIYFIGAITLLIVDVCGYLHSPQAGGPPYYTALVIGGVLVILSVYMACFLEHRGRGITFMFLALFLLFLSAMMLSSWASFNWQQVA